MRIDIATLFVDMCERVLDESIIGRARRAGKLEVYCHNIRDYTLDKHKRVDDSPYGGGMGMLMQAEPIYQCWKNVSETTIQAGLGKPYVIYLSPQGTTFTQKRACQLKEYPALFLLCGHYEGVDQRVIDEIVDEEISIGDFVLTGGELGALVLVDAVGRLCDGVLSEESCFTEESHYNGMLEYPQYTRPPIWHEKEVPEILLSGHHANIQKWHREQSLITTMMKRPDLLDKIELSSKEALLLADFRQRNSKINK